MQSLWYFENVDFYNLLCPHKLEQFRTNYVVRSYERNDYIYFEGDFSNKIYLIKTGKVKIGYCQEDGEIITKAVLAKGEIFGEKAILGEDNRSEFAQATNVTTEICTIEVNVLHTLMRANTNFSLKIYKFIGFRVQKLEKHLRLLLFKDTETRFVEFLNELSEDYGYICQKTGKQVISHPYTQKDIASLIGTSRATLIGIMKKLQKDQVIEYERKTIRVLKEIEKC